MNPDDWNLPEYVNAGNYVPAMAIELATCAVSMILVVNAVAKYLEKRNKTTLEIIFVFCGIFISALFTSIGKLLVITGTFTYPFVVYTLYLDAFAIMSVMISNTAFFLFTMDVFYDFKREKKRLLAFTYVAIEGAVAIAGIFVTHVGYFRPAWFRRLVSGRVGE